MVILAVEITTVMDMILLSIISCGDMYDILSPSSYNHFCPFFIMLYYVLANSVMHDSWKLKGAVTSNFSQR